jgi:hypothetical protein
MTNTTQRTVSERAPDSGHLKVVLVHGYYQQAGGEDQVFAAESELLEAQGHQVLRYTVHNERIERMSPLSLAGATVWHRSRPRPKGDLWSRACITTACCVRTPSFSAMATRARTVADGLFPGPAYSMPATGEAGRRAGR